MTSVKSLKKITPIIWMPPLEEIEYKIEITTATGEVIDITDDIISGEYSDGVTDVIGTFNFTIDNTTQDYTDKFALYNQIKIYSDYSTSATTLKFTGVLEKVSSKEEEITVSGRSIASRVMGRRITYSVRNTYTNIILSNILNRYMPFITQNNIDTTTSTDSLISVNWYQKPFWDCVVELCNRAEYDAYIDCNSDFNYFVSGSRQNTADAVVHESNLVEVGDFTPDLTNVKNKVIVYGGTVEDQQIIWTEQDDDSIALYDTRELIINDSSIVTDDQAQERALYELSINKDPPIVGEVTSDSLATIMPGEKIMISDQESGLNPIFYNIQKFTQSFGDELTTTLTIQKEQSNISNILKKRITFESQAIDNANPNEMESSWVEPFDTDSGTHSNTVISDGVLKTVSGSPGTWISSLKTIGSNASYYELRVSGDVLSGSQYYVSSDSGNSWQIISSLNTIYSLSLPGIYLKVKIVINSANTQIKSVNLLYK